jgi:hypothetical protein
MRFPQLITTCALLLAGMFLANFRNDIEPNVDAAASKPSQLNSRLFGEIDAVLKGDETQEAVPAAATSTPAEADCICGPNCQCNAGGTPCPCPKKTEELKELQAKYDALLTEKTAAKTATYKASSGGSTGGGSSGGLAKPVVSSTASYSTVVHVNSSNGSSGGSTAFRTPVRNVAAGVMRAVASPVVNYTPRWTYPGTIEQHMAQDHGKSSYGKTSSQLLQEHDQIHDEIRPVYSTPRSSYSTYSSSSCPGGVCPAPATRGGLFQRWRR